jgi:ParB-like chromosome segregation protein Spo0J
MGTGIARRVEDIVVGERHRRDFGDMADLVRSIADVGLLQPIVVTHACDLIAGARRLKACKELGWTEVPVNVVDLNQIVRGEFAENACRKDFTPSESVAIKRALEELEKAPAKERQREGGRRGGKASGKLPEASKGNAAEKAARATGRSRRTIDKAEAVLAAAEAEPKKYRLLRQGQQQTLSHWSEVA